MEKKNIESILKTESDNYREDVRPKLWDKLEKRMDDHYATTTPVKIVQYSWMRYAAAFILLLGAGFIISRLDSTTSNDSIRVAEQFTIEELPSSTEDDQLYKVMINFSQKMYGPRREL